MRNVGIDAVFAIDGNVQIRRVQVDGQWLAVEQGRQWTDDNGRHCLIMLPDNSAYEIVLQSNTLLWVMKSLSGSKEIV